MCETFNCHLVLLENCFLNCKMCHMWKSGKGPDITVQDWKLFLSSLKGLCPKEMQVHFVGGEPLMKPGIIDLINFSTQNKFRSSMTTNGFLIDKDKALEITKSGLDTLVISLDSLSPQTHDYLRGVKGVYRKVMEAIDYFEEIAAEKPKIHIVTTIMAQNIRDLAGLVKWADDREVIARISFQAVMQPFYTPAENTWYKNDSFSFLWPKGQGEVGLAVDELIKLKKCGSKITNPASQLEVFKAYFSSPESFVKKGICNLGSDSFTVDSFGRIFLCQDMEPIGDIRKDDIKRIWLSEKAESVRQKIRSCRRNCKSLVNCFFEEEPQLQ